MTVRVRFQDHQDWIQKQVALSKLPAIDKLSTLMLSYAPQDNMSDSVASSQKQLFT